MLRELRWSKLSLRFCTRTVEFFFGIEKVIVAVMTIFWAQIVDGINGVSISLQKSTNELLTAVNILKSLLDFLLSQLELFDDYEMKVNEETDTEYSDEYQRMLGRKRHHDDGSAEGCAQKKREVNNFKRVYQ